MIQKSQNQDQYITYGQMNLINDFRNHWNELAIWIRSYMVSTITGFSNITAISNRLYRIPSELGGMFEPFFGKDLAEQFQHLLLIYIVNMQHLINAQDARDQSACDSAVAALYRSSDEISTFLARINPYWDKNQWQSLLNQLNNLITTEMVAMLLEEYDRELDIRDRMLKHTLTMGDYMARGVMHALVPEEFPIPASGQ